VFDPTVPDFPIVRPLRIAPSARVVSQRSSETVTHVEPVLTPVGDDDDLPTSVVDAGQHQFPTLEHRPETGTWQPQEKPNHDQINRLLHRGLVTDGRNLVC
jgi:hypothetical protein